LKQAVDLAKNFLSSSAGMPTLFSTLDSVSEEEEKWIVIFKCVYFLPPPVSYRVEIDKNTGEIMEYRKIG
jgi:hypothetical protein